MNEEAVCLDYQVLSEIYIAEKRSVLQIFPYLFKVRDRGNRKVWCIQGRFYDALAYFAV